MNRDKAPVKTIFEYNCTQIDGETLGGCPICPLCKEPAYEKDHCVFCEVEFMQDVEMSDNEEWEVEE